MCSEEKEIVCEKYDINSSVLFFSKEDIQSHCVYAHNHVRSTPLKKEIRFFVEDWKNPVMAENLEKNPHSVFRHGNMLVVANTATVRIPCGNSIVVYECFFADGKVDYIDAEKEEGGAIWEPV